MTFMKGPIGGGLVADEESKVFGDLITGIDGQHAFGLEADGAETEPLVVDHFLDEGEFHVSGRLKFVEEVAMDLEEVVLVFAFEEDGGGGEAWRDVIVFGYFGHFSGSY